MAISAPTEITGCVGWYDAADAATITQSSGEISQWDDKGSAGLDVVQSTSSQKPNTVSGDLNSKDTIYFDNGDILNATGHHVSGSSSRTIFIVAKANEGSSSGNRLCHLGHTAGTGTMVFLTTELGFRCGTGVTVIHNDDTLSQVNYEVIEYNLNGTILNDLTGYKDGVLLTPTTVGKGTTTLNTSGNTAIGATEDLGGLFDGWIAELIIYDSSLSEADSNLVREYLEDKWGITIARFSVDLTSAPGQGDLTFSTAAPTVITENALSLAPGQGDLVLSQAAPELMLDIPRSPGQADLLLSVSAPALLHQVGSSPAAADLVLNAAAPTIIHDLGMSPGAADLILNAAAPALVHDLGIIPAVGVLALSTVAPAIVHTLGMSPAAADLVFDCLPPSLGDNLRFTPAVGELVLSTTAPTSGLSGHLLIDIGAGNLVIATVAPSLTGSQGSSPGAADLLFDSRAPEVEGGLGGAVGHPTEHRHLRPQRYILPDGRRVTATPSQIQSILADFLEERREAHEERKQQRKLDGNLTYQKAMEVEPMPEAPVYNYRPPKELEAFRDQPLPDDYYELELIALEYFIRRKDDEDAILVLLLI